MNKVDAKGNLTAKVRPHSGPADLNKEDDDMLKDEISQAPLGACGFEYCGRFGSP